MSIKSLLKRSKLTYALARRISRLPYPLMSGWMRLCHALIGVKPRRAYFSSFNGQRYNDNPRAVAEALHARMPEAEIVFCLSGEGMQDSSVPSWVRKVRRGTPAALAAMATSRVLVKNAGMKDWMRKFPDQYYIQTWHGDRGFKRIRLDVHPLDKYHIREGRWLDLAVSASDFGSKVYRSAFGFSGEILECGYPRNDALVDPSPEDIARARAALNLAEGTRALLYAPTFRRAGTGSRQDAGLDLEAVRAALEQATGARWTILTRSHELARGIRAKGAVDVSSVADVSRLLLAVDLLITDYSSIGGDFMLLRRPTLYYEPDRGAYDAERGLYFDPDASPLLVAHTQEELLALLSSPIDAAANCDACLAFFGAKESGHAAEAVAERVAAALGEKPNIIK